MIRKLRAGMMPPPGARRPEPAQLHALAEALETRIDTPPPAKPNPGWRPFQRLNRVEYARAVNDLLALDVDVTALLPPDTISQGFDNVADVQAFSPALMEGYLRAASRVTALAVGDPDAPSRAKRTTACRRPRRSCSASTARRSARAAASRSCTPSPPTATTSSAWICTATPTASCSAARRRASRSRCRSTASARR